MQFIPPTGLYPTEFSNYGQPYTFNMPYPFQLNGYPDIIGEGNITSIIAPDGCTQFVFVPTAHWFRPYPPNSNVGNVGIPPNVGNLNSLGAWIVRSIYGPLQPSVFQQPYQTLCRQQPYRVANSECCLDLPAPGFQLKFHNDICTSTSDIHYFFPKQYNWFQKPTGCAAVQVEVPHVANTVCDTVICTKPCNCISTEPHRSDLKDKLKHHCKCVIKSNATSSEMSVEETKSDTSSVTNSDTRKSKAKKKGKERKKSHEYNRTKSNKSNLKCECKEQTAADKSVTTYADKESFCTEEAGRQTQADCSTSMYVCGCAPRPEDSKRAAGTEVWTPITPVSKKVMSSSATRHCQSDCTGSCSGSDTDLDE